MRRPHLQLIPQISPAAANTVLRAARHYATALWIADDDPEQAWLQLVTAAEVAATQHQREEADAVGLFRRSRSGATAAALIEASTAAPDLLPQIAEAFKDTMRATGRFLTFFADFPPPEPLYRPQSDRARVDWTPRGLKNALGQVYDLRSRLLHDGRPFPYPLLGPPAADNDIPAERPFEDAYGVGNMAWTAGELPMFLPTFAYIVQMSLLDWWRSLD